MKKQLCWAMGGFLFTSVLGTLLHFAFAWSGENVAMALFSPVNESIWEHMKLIYFPMTVFAMIQYQFGKGRGAGFWCQKLVSILLALSLIPTIYYTYTGILGKSVDWFNIALFFICTGIAYRSEAIRYQRGNACPVSEKAAVFLIAFIGLVFIAFTFLTPKIPMFADPRTGRYGYWKVFKVI